MAMLEVEAARTSENLLIVGNGVLQRADQLACRQRTAVLSRSLPYVSMHATNAVAIPNF